jgi:hypothetical protein
MSNGQEPTNNLSAFLQAAGATGAANSSAVNVIGAGIGTVADFVGGVGAVISAVELAEKLALGNDNARTALQEIIDAMYTGFHELNLDLRAEDLKRQWDLIDLLFADAEAAFDSLKSDLTASPPVDSGYKSLQIQKCLAPVLVFEGLVWGEPADQWQFIHDFQVYFSPTYPWYYEGGGLPSSLFPFSYGGQTFAVNFRDPNTFDPGADANGLTFNYIYILPSYLRAIMLFLAVGAAFRPDFTRVYEHNLRNSAKFLLMIHDQIRDGILAISAPAEDDILPYTFSCNGPDQSGAYHIVPSLTPASLTPAGCDPIFDSTCMGTGYLGPSSWEVATVAPGEPNAWPPPFPQIIYPPGAGFSEYVCLYTPPYPTDFTRPFGAVNIYSGYGSVASYPDPLPDLPPGPVGGFPPSHGGPSAFPPPDWCLGFYGKYLLRTVKRIKDVYRGVGLPDVVNTVNRLRALVGDPPMPEPGFASWSLREVYSLLGGYQNHLIADPTFLSPHLTAWNIVSFLNRAPPIPPSPPPSIIPTPVSLRQLLEG